MELAEKRYLLVIAIAVVTNSVIYSYFAYLRYMSYNSYVYDLGVTSELAYMVLHDWTSIQPGMGVNNLIFFPIGLIYGLHPYPLALEYFQSIWLSLGAVPIYLIAKGRIGDRRIAFLISIAYLLYYPLGGAYWFDFHFMALFPTFLLLSFLFMDNGKYRLSLFMAILAGLSDFLVPLILVFYGVYAIIEDHQIENRSRPRELLSYFLIPSGVVIFLITLVYAGIPYLFDYSSGRIAVPTLYGVNASLPYRIGYFGWIMYPLLFTSFLSPSSLLMIIPYLGFAVKNQYTPFVNSMFYQYPVLTAPIIFYSAILGFARIRRMWSRRFKNALRHLRRVAYTMLLLDLVLALFFTPAGVLLTHGNMNSNMVYGLTGMTEYYNTQNLIQQHGYDHSIAEVMSLIPKGSTVLIQNNMPQLTSGYQWLIPDGYNIHNLSSPDFVIVDTYNRAYYTSYFTSDYQMNMAYDASYFLSNHIYGVYAESEGVLLLKKNYSQAPVLWKPVEATLSSATYSSTGAGNASFVFSSSAYNSNMILPNGLTNVTVMISGNNLSDIGNVSLGISWKYSVFSDPGYSNFTLPDSIVSGNGSVENGFILDTADSVMPLCTFSLGLHFNGPGNFRITLGEVQVRLT